MYFDYEVKIPDSRHGITRKKIRGITYIYYAYDHKHSSDKHYRYEAELEQLNQLMKKRDELRNKELLQAIEHSNRSFEEIMDFLGTDDFQD